MGYATRGDIDNRISQSELVLLTDEGGTGAVQDDKINAALEAADVEIDSYLAARYPLPLVAPQPLLTTLAVDIAIWNLYGVVGDASGVPEVRKERYQGAVKTLVRLSSGSQTLGTSPQQAGSEAAVFSGPGRLFGRDKMRGL